MKKTKRNRGSRIHKVGPITIATMNPNYRDCLDRIMEAYREHWKGIPENGRSLKDPDDAYQFAYWLLRWSGLVKPTS